MTDKTYDEEAIFKIACQIASPEARVEYLHQICGGNDAVLGRVKSLLRVYEDESGFLESPPHGVGVTTDVPVIPEKPGTQIGPYKLLQVIGEGGMGVVYMAEQTEPVKRKVALKLIKPGMDSRQVIARFEAERQALSMMDHVNIARVLDAGTTSGEPGGVSPGRPYFVMELIHGVTITKYCNDNHLTPRERLELFVPVCQAIQHAHQKGIIHRDIKPSNVMITLYDGKPVPKVIDFGVAKATEQNLTERTLFTQYGTMVGTLEYMSPEQAEMSALGVDTRSDIYSLGVLLYELLTGSTPLIRERVRGAAYAEVLRRIKEEEPPRPSTRLSESGESLASISAQRQMDPAQLTKLMRGELDWIVMKTLEKDRNRRYETANGFAADVQRYLNDEQVQACPPSAGYRLQKFVRRNRGIVSAVSVVFAVLLIGIAGTTWGLLQAEQGRTAADKSRRAEATQRAEAVSNLYDSLVGEARALRLARATGFREQVWQRLRQADRLETPKRSLDQLRNEAAACLGDFVGLQPTILKDFGEEQIRVIAIHSQSAQLAIGFTDGSLSMHRLPDGEEIARWMGHASSMIHSIAFDPAGKGFASAADDGTIVLWAPDSRGGWTCHWTHTIDPEYHHNLETAMTVDFTHDGTQLAVCSASGSAIQFLLTTDGRRMTRFEAPDRLSGSMALSPDGTLLAAGHRGNGEHTVCVWDVATGKIIQNLLPELAHVTDLKFSPDGNLLACGCGAGTAVFDAATFQRRLFFQGGNIYDVDFTPDSQLLVCGTQHSTRLWDVVTNREVATLLQPHAPEDPAWSDFVKSIALTADGKTIVSAGRTRIVLWDLAGASERALLKRFAGGIPGLAFSPQGDVLASVSYDRTVTLWDPSTGQLIRCLTGCQGEVQAVAFSPDGRLLATGDYSKGESVRMWDVKTGVSLVTLDPELGEVWSVAFSRDGRYFAAGGERGWTVWNFDRDPANRSAGTEPLLEVVTHKQITKGVGSLGFTPDGSLLAWVDRDRTFHLWDLAALQERRAPRINLKAYVLAVGLDVNAISSQERGQWLWLGAPPEGTEIWDMATGQKVGLGAYPRELEALSDELKLGWCHALSPDRTKWAVGTGDGNLVLWDLTKVRARLEEAGLGWDTEKQ